MEVIAIDSQFALSGSCLAGAHMALLCVDSHDKFG